MTATPAHRPAPGHDPIPLLPRGAVVFEDLPLRAMIIEALPAVIRDGTLVARDGDRGAVILVRGGDAWEVHVIEGDSVRTGAGLLKAIQGWPDAVVSAERLDSPLVDLCAALLRGDTVYDDLRLLWVNWPSLLADLGQRGGTFVVEITTPAGRGVTCVTEGRQALSYTDIHPSLGDPALLEAMASNRDGTVRVRRVGDSGFSETSAVAVSSASATAAAASAAAVTAEPAPSQAPSGTAPSAAGSEKDREPIPAVAWVAPWDTPWRETSPGGAAGNGGGAHASAAETAGEQRPATWQEFTSTALAAEPAAIAEVLDDLRAIAQRRLQLSASRVEVVLDEAALERRPLESVLDEIRAMSIRGVMPSTVEEMVDEMSEAARRRGR